MLRDTWRPEDKPISKLFVWTLEHRAEAYMVSARNSDVQKSIIIRRNKMFEITYDGEEIFDYHREYGRVHPKGEYEFTFENRFLIFKQPNKNRFEYIAFDMKTNRTSRIEERSADELYSDLTHEAMIPKILYSIKYTGDTRYADYLSANPKQIIDSIFRDVLPRYGYAVREEQIQLAKSIYEGFTQNRVTICEAEVGTGKSATRS